MERLVTLLSRGSLKFQIIIGAFPILITLIVISILGFQNLRTLGQLLEGKKEIFTLNRSTSQLEVDFLILQRNVISYSYLGYDGVIKKIKKVEAQIDKNIEQISSSTDNSQLFISERINRVQNHYSGYKDGFTQAIQKKRELKKTNTLLFELETQTMELINSIEIPRGNPRFWKLIYLLQRNASLITSLRKDYLDMPDSSIIRRINNKIALQKETLATLQKELASTSEPSITRLLEMLGTYPDIFRKLANINRSYLYLINVVLAGKTVEIDTLTEEIRNFTLSQRVEISNLISNKIKEIYRDTILWTAIGTAFSIVFLLLITSGITRPITAISQTLTLLSQKQGAPKIPALDRKDEIGKMALAAQSFKKMSEELEESEIRTKTILETAVDGLITINDRGLIETFNPASETIFGYKKEEVIGKNIKLLMPEPDKSAHDQYLSKYHKHHKKTIMDSSREVLAMRKNGEIFPIDLSLSEVKLANKTIYSGIIRDVSERKKNELQLAKYSAELERSNEELDNFAYVASHDLKAPLRVIDNAATWISEDLGEHFDEESKENMALMRNRIKRMEKLLNDLLEYSRMGRKTEKSYQEFVTGKEIFNNIITLLSPPETFEIKIDPSLEEKEIARMPIQQVFYNLIGNAIKHHDKDAGRIEVSLINETDSYYHFSVKDDGPGIAPQYQEQVFKMFQTLRPRDQVEGSGMGLAMVKKTIENYGANLQMKSDEGAGTTFIFHWTKTLPTSE